MKSLTHRQIKGLELRIYQILWTKGKPDLYTFYNIYGHLQAVFLDKYPDKVVSGREEMIVLMPLTITQQDHKKIVTYHSEKIFSNEEGSDA